MGALTFNFMGALKLYWKQEKMQAKSLTVQYL